MAKIGNTPIDGKSERSGDIVYTKKDVEKTAKQTEKQKEAASNFNIVNKLWSNLKYEEVKQWELLNKRKKIFRNKNYQTNNIFVKLNMNLLNIGEELIRLPYNPEQMDEPDIPSKVDLSIRIGSNAEEMLLYVRPESGKNTKLILYATKPVKFGRNFVDKEYRKICILEYEKLNGISILQNYRETFKEFSFNNKKVFYYLKPIHKLSGLEAFPVYGMKVVEF